MSQGRNHLLSLGIIAILTFSLLPLPAQGPVKNAVVPAPTAPPDANLLKELVSSEGRFSILMPGVVTSTTQTNTDGAQPLVLHLFYATSDNNNIAYIVEYNDFPDGSRVSADVALTKCRDGVMDGKTLLTDKTIDLNGVPGRAYTGQDKNGYKYDTHAYYVNSRLYQIMIVAGQGYVAQYRDSVMNSFTIK